ncbi:ribonuclease T [Ignatzschineria cameli]|uniref:Ribonuclease T n=1 Tax=Ignatzschineria cameli TaxID=2182793 RepID=A0A2U2ATI5_9GAMM|nr:ribonuclease T [Ignatzschineria cameli]PWD87460.1 ribonuclease T [Ignatzschineria cameli]PWD88041.1 ribonuclease T [Ignatzschineria cameli]PWD91073.1 ribonuclease T [Ignatzschineria cameli]PWD92715.1 ribonuclease T [Ignatzschineria cameli]PWD93735.1 ribonuclease T [Ignatzschineria cameli]
MADHLQSPPPISMRFRGFLPVVIDVETGGVNPRTDALLEIAAVVIDMSNEGELTMAESVSAHIEPEKGLLLNPESMKINGIKIDNPFRFAISEKEALKKVFAVVRAALKEKGCTRAILVGHNAHFDLAFLNAAIERTGIKNSPFHPFSVIDTVSLAGLAYGQTVLARAIQAAGIEWDHSRAHSALYDTEKTAELFCNIVNIWQEKVGFNLALFQPNDDPIDAR